jgi:hypothetical protein
MQEMAETLRRNIIIVNLDPAAEHSDYKCDIGNTLLTYRHSRVNHFRRCYGVNGIRTQWGSVVLYLVPVAKSIMADKTTG